jgi:hypothetical protein
MGEHDYVQCVHIFKKRLQPLAESFGTKKSHKNSYTIPKRPPNERHGECIKVEISVSRFKVTIIFLWKLLTKKGMSTFAYG